MDKFIDETLDESDKFPVEFEDNPFYDLELSTMNYISFSVADSPFVKAEISKYYPEAIVLNGQGQILTHIVPSELLESGFVVPGYQNPFPGLKYRNNFRDEKIRINDDRKIELFLDEF